MSKCLLLLLANAADPSGVCYPGHNYLVAHAECSRRTVVAQLEALKERGLLGSHPRHRVNGSRATDWLVLAPPSESGAVDRGEMLDVDPDLWKRWSETMCISRTVRERGGPELYKSIEVAPTTVVVPKAPVGREEKKEIKTIVETAEVPVPLPGFEALPASSKEDWNDAEVLEVFNHWVRTFDPPRTNLSPSRRRLIEKGLKETESVDVCKTAINGLKVWRLRRPGDESLGAIFQTRPGGSSLGDQIDFWVRKAEEGGMQTIGRIPTSLSGVPDMTAGTIRGLRQAVQGASERPNDEGEQERGRYAMQQLAQVYGHEPVVGGETNFRQSAAWQLIEGWEG